MAVISFTSGVPGVGKTLKRCAVFLATDFLPNQTGLHISNFPVKREPLCEWVSRKYGLDYDALMERVVVIPEEVHRMWTERVEKDGTVPAGPWNYFLPNDEAAREKQLQRDPIARELEEKGLARRISDLEGAHFAVDEYHEMVPQTKGVINRRYWSKWLAMVRHVGCTVELISQNFDDVHKEGTSRVEVQWQIVSRCEEGDPFFGIRLYDWYQFKAKLMGKWNPASVQKRLRKDGRTWHVVDREIFWCGEPWYSFYDSYNSPLDAGAKAGKKSEMEWERFSWLRLLGWFIGRNVFKLVPRLAFACFIIFCLHGLLAGTLLKRFSELTSGAIVSAGTVEDPGVPEDGVAGQLPDTATGSLQPEVVQEIERLVHRMELERLQVEREAAAYQEAYELLEEEMEFREMASAVVVAIGPDYVVFSTGELVRVASVIKTSGFKGQTLEGVDNVSKSCVIDGQSYYLRVPESGAGGTGWGVERVLSGGGRARGVEGGNRGTFGEGNHAVGVRNAPVGLSENLASGSGVIGGGGGRFGDPDRLSGRYESGRGTGPERGGASSWGGADGAERPLLHGGAGATGQGAPYAASGAVRKSTGGASGISAAHRDRIRASAARRLGDSGGQGRGAE
jgi:hypothetical protein